MRFTIGAIFLLTRPATIMRSACRGDARNTSAPKRARSYRAALVAIISMAQHASPNVAGQSEDRRAQLTIFSTVVVRIPSGTNSSKPMRSRLSWPAGDLAKFLRRLRKAGQRQFNSRPFPRQLEPQGIEQRLGRIKKDDASEHPERHTDPLGLVDGRNEIRGCDVEGGSGRKRERKDHEPGPEGD